MELQLEEKQAKLIKNNNHEEQKQWSIPNNLRPELKS